MNATRRNDGVTNVVIAGLGGQGVIKASDILAEAAFSAGMDVKKSEIHGMSQRGGSVSADVRFGPRVLSPMVPPGEADFLVVLAEDQIDNYRHVLREGGILFEPAAVEAETRLNRRVVNVALLGRLARHLEIPLDVWRGAIRKHLNKKLHDDNLRVFDAGRQGD
ncbi:MAG: pyruvate ferredoxin oxidoreductase [Pirellulaceae bacterium]|nr:pyruvate ferredoxin oxidoreductase [Pirellulaceae bacterium]